MEMSAQRWAYTTAYLRTVFGAEDARLRTLMDRAAAAGLPPIAVSADVGRLLLILASMTNGGRGARLIVEVGTLAGYSGIWLARALAPDGRLVTIEPNEKHAAFAEREFEGAGVRKRIEVRRGAGLDLLPAILAERGPGCADVLFLDAIKREYPDYFRVARPLIAVGGLLIADNALGSRDWWIDEPEGVDPDRDGADRLNRTVAADPDFEAVALPLREGVLIARRIR